MGDRQMGKKYLDLQAIWCSLNCSLKQKHNKKEIRLEAQKRGEMLCSFSSGWVKAIPSDASASALRPLNYAAFLTCEIRKPPGSAGDLFTRSRVYAELQTYVF